MKELDYSYKIHTREHSFHYNEMEIRYGSKWKWSVYYFVFDGVKKFHDGVINIFDAVENKSFCRLEKEIRLNLLINRLLYFSQR